MTFLFQKILVFQTFANFLGHWYLTQMVLENSLQCQFSENLVLIYPSRRHNRPPTLEIITRNSQKSWIFQNFQKNPTFSTFLWIFPKPQKGRHWDQRGCHLLPKLSIISREIPKIRVYNIKHYLPRSCLMS